MNRIEELNKLCKPEIPDFAHDKFIEVYSKKFGEDNAEAFFVEQKGFFLNELRLGSYKNMLERATNTSVYFAFMFLAISGLSLEKGITTTCYLECRSQKVGEDERRNPIYENNACITVTGYGEIVMRQRAGQIRSVDTPKVVFDCDTFRYGERDGKPFVTYEKVMPKPSTAKLMACYVRIVKNDGSTDYFVLDIDGINRLKQYSAKLCRGKVNALYGSQADCSDIDEGFLKSKTIKHAFKGYPKLSLGSGGMMESDKDEQVDATEQETPVNDTAFGKENENDGKQGVTVNTSEDIPF